MHAFPRPHRGVSLLETLIVVFALSLLGGMAAVYFGQIRSVSSQTKLESDVAAVNASIRVYLANGGSFAGVTSPQAILDKMKTRRADAESYAGFRGAMVDPRLAAVLQTPEDASSSTPRATWNPGQNRFEVRGEGEGGVARFELRSELGRVDYGTEVRENSTVAYNTGNGWIWSYDDQAPALPGGPSQVLTTPAAAPSQPAAKAHGPRLETPVSNPAGGTYDFLDFPREVTLVNPNEPSVSVVYYATTWSANGIDWQRYQGEPIALAPGTRLRTYAASTTSAILDSFTGGGDFMRRAYDLVSPVIQTSAPTMSLEDGSPIQVTVTNGNPAEVPQRLEYAINGGEWTPYSGTIDVEPGAYPPGFEIAARVAGGGEGVNDSETVRATVPIVLRRPLIQLSDDTFSAAVPEITVAMTNPNPAGSSRILYRVRNLATNGWTDWTNYSVPLSFGSGAFSEGFVIEGFAEPLTSAFLPSELAVDDADAFFGVPVTGRTIFVLDVSGSMQWNARLDQVKSEMETSLERLGSGDGFAIVSFATDARVVFNWSEATDSVVAAAAAAVTGMEADGWTNYSAALDQALAIVQAGAGADQVIFLSDGQPTAGETSETAILERVDALVAAGVRVDTIGFEVPTQEAQDLLDAMGSRGGR